MSVASRPVSTGKTRTCPHCKATILESLSICPGCMHHLRFDSEAAKRQVAAAPALRVEGIIRHPPLEQPLEYFVIIAIRNDRGEEVTRQVVNVGALQAAEKRTFTLSVEVLPPQAPVPTKSTASTGTFKSPIPQPSATVRSPTSPATSASPPTGPAAGGSTAARGSTAAGGATAATTAGGSTAAGGAAAGGSGAAAGASGSVGAGSAAPGNASVAGRPPGASGQQMPPQGAQSSRGMPTNPSSNPNVPGSNSVRSGGANPARSSGPDTGRVPGANPAPNSNTVKPPATPANPTNPVNPGNAANPANPANPADPAKPTSGYVLKPPSPGGPKRH